MRPRNTNGTSTSTVKAPLPSETTVGGSEPPTCSTRLRSRGLNSSSAVSDVIKDDPVATDVDVDVVVTVLSIGDEGVGNDDVGG